MGAVIAVRTKVDGQTLDPMVLFYPVTTADMTRHTYELLADGP